MIFTRQPQYLARINRGQQYANKIAFVWSGAFPLVEQITSNRPTTDNTVKIAASVGKVVSSSAGQVNLEWNRQFITTSTGDGLGDYTISVYANPASSGSAVEHVFAQKNDAGGSPFSQTGLLAHADSGASFSSGSFSFFTFNGSASSGVAAAGACDGAYHVWTGIRRGSVHELYKDGVLIASSSLTIRGITQAASRYTAIGSRGNGDAESYTQKAVLALGWDRALNPTETKINPWQIFLAPTRRSAGFSTSAISAAVGNAVGSSATSASALSIFQAAGVVVGTSSLSSSIQAIAQSSGSVAGLSTVAGSASAIAKSDAAASGVSSVSANIRAIFQSAGSAIGISNTSTVANAIWNIVGGTSGSSSVNGGTNTVWNASGTAIGSSSGVASTSSIWVVVGASNGLSTANASTSEGDTVVSVDGNSSGNSTVSATASAIISTVGSSSGVSSVQGIATYLFEASGQSTGSSTINANVIAIQITIASSSGVSSVEALSQAIKEVVAQAVGSSSGQATSGNAAGQPLPSRLEITIITPQYGIENVTENYSVRLI